MHLGFYNRDGFISGSLNPENPLIFTPSWYVPMKLKIDASRPLLWCVMLCG